jgi:ABC-type lipoprotein export system ATPase subunit
MRTLAERIQCTPSMGREEVVGLQNVTSHLPNGSPVLKDITFKVGRGEFVWVKGPTGSGKSTAHRTAAGIETPTEGQVRLFGEDIHTMKPRKLDALFRDKIGLGFQKPALKDNWSVAENLLYYPDMTGTTTPNTVQLATGFLERFGLLDKANMAAATLSGGQQQQVALGSLLVNRPELLLLDEPTSAMDGPLKHETLGLLRDLSYAGTTIMMVSHDAQTAEYATRALHIEDGQLCDEGSPTIIPSIQERSNS